MVEYEQTKAAHRERGSDMSKERRKERESVDYEQREANQKEDRVRL